MEYNFQQLSNTSYLNKIKKDLLKNGYIIINHIYTADEINFLKLAFKDLLIIAKSQSAHDETLRHVFNGTNYDELSNSVFSNALHRGNESNYDQGMIDIFNPLTWLAKNYPLALGLIERLRSPQILEIIQSVDARVRPRTSNFYIHENVQNPRCLHVDALRNYFKVFLALSDQTNASCGPFSVVPGSHINKIRNYLMCLYNSKISKHNNPTDASFYSDKHAEQLLLEVGSIAVCNQSIVHGASPAKPGKKRLTFVQTFDR